MNDKELINVLRAKLKRAVCHIEVHNKYSTFVAESRKFLLTIKE